MKQTIKQGDSVLFKGKQYLVVKVEHNRARNNQQIVRFVVRTKSGVPFYGFLAKRKELQVI